MTVCPGEPSRRTRPKHITQTTRGAARSQRHASAASATPGQHQTLRRQADPLLTILEWILKPIFDALTGIEESLTSLHTKVDATMAAVQIQQEDLDAFASEIQTSAELIGTELAALVADAGNPLTAADVTGLQAAVDSLRALEPPHPEQV